MTPAPHSPIPSPLLSQGCPLPCGKLGRNQPKPRCISLVTTSLRWWEPGAREQRGSPPGPWRDSDILSYSSYLTETHGDSRGTVGHKSRRMGGPSPELAGLILLPQHTRSIPPGLLTRSGKD